jgi:hypothetical protein
MRVRMRGDHLNGVRARKYEYVTRPCKSARKIPAWLHHMYRVHISPFGLNVGTTKSVVETTHKRRACSAVRIELWRARIRTGCYQVNGQTLATCILVKEAHFFEL